MLRVRRVLASLMARDRVKLQHPKRPVVQLRPRPSRHCRESAFAATEFTAANPALDVLVAPGPVPVPLNHGDRLVDPEVPAKLAVVVLKQKLLSYPEVLGSAAGMLELPDVALWRDHPQLDLMVDRVENSSHE